MIVFASFVPHPPLLIPEVGKENLTKLNNTKEAYQHLEAELYAAKPEVLIIISPHAELREDAFAISQQPKLLMEFKEFGDLVTKKEFNSELGLGYRIKESSETALPIVLTAQSVLDYGAGVPLFYLTAHLPQIKVVLVSYADLPYEQHIAFGQAIHDTVSRSGQRTAIIASGDLSHRLHQDSPAGYSPRGQEFDQTIIRLLQDKKIDALVNLEEELVKEAASCGLRSLLILLGAIKNLNYTPEKISYQAPFGIGYLVENFKLNN